MIIALSAALSAIAFPGGDISELARSIAENTKKDVVFLAGGREYARPFTYEPSDPNELARAVLNGTKFRQAPGLDIVFHRGRLGSWLFQSSAVRLLAYEESHWGVGSSLPENSVKDGLVTIHHKREEATMLDSVPPILPKPLIVHWVYEKLAFKAWVTGQPAMEFARFLAKAVGGRLVEKKLHFLIDLDPVEVQRRALKTLDQAAKQELFKDLSEADKQQFEFCRATVSAASASEIGDALATPDGKVRVQIGFALRATVQKYLDSLVREARQTAVQDRIEDPNPGAVNPVDRLKRIDRRIIGFAELNAQFQVRIFLQSVDAAGRPGPMIQVP